MITSLGADKQTCFHAFCEGVSGNRPLQVFNHEQFNTRRAYEIPDREPEQPDVKGRSTRWLCAAINEAIRAAGLKELPARVAVIIGTGLRELRSLELYWADQQPMHVTELHFGRAVCRATNQTARVLTFSNACSASNFALGLGGDLLALDEADVVIVAGCDSITESMFGLLDRVNPLHPDRVQPLDQHRRGVLMGEGAAAMVLETAEHAQARGAGSYAWLRGVGMNCDAYHETAPDLDGLLGAMHDAHQRAGIQPADIDLLMIHGTGTIRNDETEATALAALFGTQASTIQVTGLKSMTGHTSGASGLVGVVTAIECFHQQRVPPTIGVTELIPEAQHFDVILDMARKAAPRLAQVNAFGFGGVNAVVIVERADS
jgi:3-oxoacyl-[acyl-carrier-protein] synthase II